MPKYTVELDDGRKVSFEADRPLSQSEIEETAYEAIGANKPSTASRLGETVRSGASGLVDMVTGRDRQTPEMAGMKELDLPPAPTFGGALKTGLGMTTAMTNKQRKEIVAENYPNVSFREDPKGNTIIDYPAGRRPTIFDRITGSEPSGEEYPAGSTALNKPGLSTIDALSGGAQALMFAKTGAKTIGKATSLIPRVFRGATAAAGTSAALDLTSNAAGAKSDLNEMGTRAAIAGAFGGTAEALAPVVGRVYTAIRDRLMGAPIVNGAGGLTPQAREAMRGAGINPDDLDDQFMTLLRRYASQTDDPAVAARAAQGESLPVPVQQTRGQLTGDPAMQRFEEGMRYGSYGDTAGQRMRGVRADQQAQLRGNVDAIQERLSPGGRQVVAEGQGGAMVSNRLAAMRDGEKAAVDAAYDAARAKGPAFAPGRVADVANQRITAAVSDNFVLDTVPKTQRVLADMNRIIPDEATPVSIKDLFQWRQRMSGVRSDGGAEAKAAGMALREFDTVIDDMLDQALLTGDDQAVAAWREAIGKNRDYAARFKGKDLVGDLVEVDYGTNSRALKVDPTSAANYILGRAKMGPVGKQNIVPDLKKLRSILGPDSAEWNAVREEAFMRFARAGDGPMAGGEQAFSGAGFKKNWQNAWKQDEPLMSQLFTVQERKLIDQFADVAGRVTSPVPGGSNPSGTAYALVDQLAARAGFVGRAVTRYMRDVEGSVAASEAVRFPFRQTVRPGIGTAVGGMSGGRYGEGR